MKQVALGTILIDTAETGAAMTPAAAAAPALSGALADGLPISPAVSAPWGVPIATASTTGWVSAEGGDAIRRGLGDTDASITAEMLSTASEQLLAEAPGLSADELLRLARQLRDEIDADGVARRERQRQDARELKYWVRKDCMHELHGLFDQEKSYIIFAALDRLLGPRRGAPRFVDKVQQSRAQAILDDPRTDAQMCADNLVELVRVATTVDPTRMFGSRRPAVRVLVTERNLSARSLAAPLPRLPGGANSPPGHAGGAASPTELPGHGYIEGVPDPVSRETVDRYLCDTGTVGVLFDDEGQCTNVGRAERTFTERQRIGLAARDGGCMIGDCDRPPAWCEAHHVEEWDHDDGHTDIADGSNGKYDPFECPSNIRRFRLKRAGATIPIQNRRRRSDPR